uniref:Uncharacterized protein n=1 Tax=Arundo donax TaxID=35708 RepID=A0A0A9EWD5_ARUDO
MIRKLSSYSCVAQVRSNVIRG